MKNILVIIIMISMIFLLGCKGIHRNNNLVDLKINDNIINAKINANNNIIEIYTNKGVSYWDKEGNCIFDTSKNALEEDYETNLVFGENVALCNVKNHKNLHYFYLDELEERHNRSFYKRAHLDHLIYCGNDIFLVFLNNKKVCSYSFKNKVIKYHRINKLEDSICNNFNSGKDFYFITNDFKFYKGHLDKQRTHSIYKIQEKFNDYKIYPLGKDSFAIISSLGLYCYGPKGLIYKSLFDKNEKSDSFNLYTSKNGKYVLLDSIITYKKNNKVLSETYSTLHNLKDKKILWSKGSLFKSINCFAVSNSGFVYSKDNNKIIKYSKEFVQASDFKFEGNIKKIIPGANCIFVITNKNHIYIINIYPI